MKLQPTSLLCTVVGLVLTLLSIACSTSDNLDDYDWDFLEPAEAEEPGDEFDDDELYDEPEASEPEPEPGKAIDCSKPHPEEWDSDEFTFVVYRYLACQRDFAENILFSPAALRIALGERAEHLGGSEGHSIAERFGYDDTADFVADTDSYRTELLDRRPVPSRKYEAGSGYWDYHFDVDDPDRLREAVGLEFYSADCGEPSEVQCQWTAQNDRWSADFPGAPAPTIDHPFSSETAAMIFRGQWESHLSPNAYPMEFHVPNGQVVEQTHRILSLSGQLHDDNVSIHQGRILGGEISIIFIHPRDLSLERVEGQLSADLVHGWIDSIERSSRKPLLRFTNIELSQSVDIAELMQLGIPLQSATEIATDGKGINSPNALELQSDFDGMRGGGATIRDQFRLQDPFIFLVYDHPTESILSIARVSNPLSH